MRAHLASCHAALLLRLLVGQLRDGADEVGGDGVIVAAADRSDALLVLRDPAQRGAQDVILLRQLHLRRARRNVARVELTLRSLREILLFLGRACAGSLARQRLHARRRERLRPDPVHLGCRRVGV